MLNLVSESLLTAFALVLILEGLLPFLAPGMWREAFRKATELSEGQIRFIGLASVVVGLAMLAFFNG